MTWVMMVAKVRCQQVRVMAIAREEQVSLIKGSVRS